MAATWTGPDATFWVDRPVAVTGATGFVGSHLVEMLVELGAAVVVLRRDHVRQTAITASWTKEVSFVDGDLASASLLERLLGDYEVTTVFHLAAQSQVGVANENPLETFESNVKGTWTLLEAVRRSPSVTGVVVASSDKAYGRQEHLPYREDLPLNAVNPYDVSKACGDMIATSYASSFDVPVAITRCGNFYGPGDTNWARLIPGTIRSLLRSQRPVLRSDGTMTRDYFYVRDGVRAYACLAEALDKDNAVRGQAFNFSSGEPLSVFDLVGKLQEATGTDLDLDVRATATNEITHQWLSSDKAQGTLGWTPGWTLEEALAETVAWYRKHIDG